LGNQADTMIQWKFLEYFLVYKLCNLLDVLIGLQWNTPYSKSNQYVTRFMQHWDRSDVKTLDLTVEYVFQLEAYI